MSIFVHPTAVVEDGAEIGDGTRIWHFCHVRAGARIGRSCILGKNVYVDAAVRVGNNVKIQNNVSIYHGVEIADGVFLGPHACFTNDLSPRAIKLDGTLRGEEDWVLARTFVGYGASIGANATIVAGTRIGQWALVGAGAVVTRDVPDYALVYGNPARLRGVVAPTGEIVSRQYRAGRYQAADGSTSFEVPEPGPGAR
ncbi:MAG: N-acetyltransferase [Deltaproteobacteria bacterium]|nr:N-acetyltransferase [Deltaproteobacteria bacterium]